MVFETKKVRTETLNEYLRVVRGQAGLSMEDVSEKTGICVKFLNYLEAGTYEKLPPNVYVAGFLKQLAALYSVSDKALLEQYKKEQEIVARLGGKASSAKRSIKSYFAGIVLTPKLIGILAGVGFTAITGAYLIVQLVMVSSASELAIKEPTPGQLVTQSFVKISGKTDPGTSLTVNDQNSIFVDASGSFTTTIPVVAGQTNLLFTATNKFSKKTQENIPIVVNLPAVADQDPSASTGKEIVLKLDFTRPVTLDLTVDGTVLVSQLMEAGSTKSVTAKNMILVSTSDGGSTVATVNDQKVGPLGRLGERMSQVPFSAEIVGAFPSPVAANHLQKDTSN